MFEVENYVQKLQNFAIRAPLGVLTFLLGTCLPFKHGTPAPALP